MKFFVASAKYGLNACSASDYVPISYFRDMEQQPSKIPRLDSLLVKKLVPEATIPQRATPQSAGYDLSSAEKTVVPARGKALVKTGLSIAVPTNTYGRVAPRSSLAWKSHIDVGAGVIDADYRGPVGVVLFNHADTDFHINIGDRIAQLVLERIETPEVIEVTDLDATDRGAGGFGSTGVNVVTRPAL